MLLGLDKELSEYPKELDELELLEELLLLVELGLDKELSEYPKDELELLLEELLLELEDVLGCSLKLLSE